MTTKVLVAFASKHGSTRGIAQAIGGALHSCGFQVRVAPASIIRSIAEFDAVVLGSAVYHERWLWDGRRLLRRVRPELAGTPVWLFSSGPVGGTADGEALIATGCGGGTAVPPELLPALQGVHVFGHATFPGRVDGRAVGMLERHFPRGDWRDFRQVTTWGRLVGDEILDAVPSQRSSRAVRG
jgi:menaquinone-dependent protoporphyrinogen oxidase